MSNIQQLLNEELRRQARKELRTELVELKKQLALLRKTITEQNRRLKVLEKVIPQPVKPQQQPTGLPTDAKPVRITADRIKKLRMRLCLSQGKFAALLGVNLNSVRYWESGKIEPREAQKRKIAAIRDLGKRKLTKLMAEKNIMVKSRTPEKSGEPANEQKEQSGKTESQTQGEKTVGRSK